MNWEVESVVVGSGLGAPQICAPHLFKPFRIGSRGLDYNTGHAPILGPLRFLNTFRWVPDSCCRQKFPRTFHRGATRKHGLCQAMHA